MSILPTSLCWRSLSFCVQIERDILSVKESYRILSKSPCSYGGHGNPTTRDNQ